MPKLLTTKKKTIPGPRTDCLELPDLKTIGVLLVASNIQKFEVLALWIWHYLVVHPSLLTISPSWVWNNLHGHLKPLSIWRNMFFSPDCNSCLHRSSSQGSELMDCHGLFQPNNAKFAGRTHSRWDPKFMDQIWWTPRFLKGRNVPLWDCLNMGCLHSKGLIITFPTLNMWQVFFFFGHIKVCMCP